MGIRKLTIFAVLTTMLLSVAGAQAQFTSRRITDQQLRALLTRLETRTDSFRVAIDRRLDNSRLNNTRAEDNVMAYVEEFENATDALRSSFDSRRATAAEATEVLNYGWYIDDYMRRNRLGAAPENQWRLIRMDLDQLARYYSVSWNWNQTTAPFPSDRFRRNRLDDRLTGTFTLNTGLSDNAASVIDRSISNTSVRARQRQNLERRLTAPQQLVLETRGNTVTMATDFGQPVTFTADGVARSETNARGRTTRTTVSLGGSGLSIDTNGDRNNDFLVTITAVGNDRIRMTRRIYLENQNQMISSTSVYDRTSTVAQWPRGNDRPGWNDGRTGSFYIPNGTRLTAVLRNRIETNVSQAGDPFTMEVTSPNQYRGAVIHGRIVRAERSGRFTGRANLAMDLQSIQYRGTTYNFAGIIDSAREADGDVINVNNEGTVRDGNQTTRTVTRAGIGAVLGALIGAIAGGGEGAAIGAGVGAGAGAGSVLIQGRDNLQLEAGSEFSITATAPANVGYRN